MTDKKITQRLDGAMKRRARQAGMSEEPYREDGFVNLLNKYGTNKDLMENYFYASDPIVPDDVIEQFYEGDGLFAKIIDMPSEEVVKNGFELKNISDDKIVEYYTNKLDYLDWEETAIDAMKWTRLFGGALVVMLIDDGRALEEPVDWKNIRSVDELVLFDRSEVFYDEALLYGYSQELPTNGRRNALDTPEYFSVFSQYGSFTVHESRCLIFKNGKLPNRAGNSIYKFWGMPEYPKVYRAIRNVELAQNSAPKMLEKSVQPVYSMKNLMEELATDGGEERLLKRLDTIDSSRGIMNTITIDSEGEDYSFRQFTFTGVSDAINSSATYLSAVSNIPQALLFGTPISGMSSTDDTAMETYYNYVQRYQKKTIKGNLRYLLKLIFRAAVNRGKIDEMPDINIEFNPLWSLNETQKVALDIQKAQAEQIRAATALQYMQAQVIDPSEIRKSLAESSEFDIETMMDEYTEEELEEFMPKEQEEGQDPMAAMMGAMGGGGAPMGGAPTTPQAPKPQASAPKAEVAQSPMDKPTEKPKEEVSEEKITVQDPKDTIKGLAKAVEGVSDEELKTDEEEIEYKPNWRNDSRKKGTRKNNQEALV